MSSKGEKMPCVKRRTQTHNTTEQQGLETEPKHYLKVKLK